VAGGAEFRLDLSEPVAMLTAMGGVAGYAKHYRTINERQVRGRF
jgi:hypothetical protein